MEGREIGREEGKGRVFSEGEEGEMERGGMWWKADMG